MILRHLLKRAKIYKKGIKLAVIGYYIIKKITLWFTSSEKDRLKIVQKAAFQTSTMLKRAQIGIVLWKRILPFCQFSAKSEHSKMHHFYTILCKIIVKQNDIYYKFQHKITSFFSQYFR